MRFKLDKYIFENIELEVLLSEETEEITLQLIQTRLGKDDNPSYYNYYASFCIKDFPEGTTSLTSYFWLICDSLASNSPNFEFYNDTTKIYMTIPIQHETCKTVEAFLYLQIDEVTIDMSNDIWALREENKKQLEQNTAFCNRISNLENEILQLKKLIVDKNNV
jgi:hypothetical protein